MLYLPEIATRTLAFVKGDAGFIEGAAVPGWLAGVKRQSPRLPSTWNYGDVEYNSDAMTEGERGNRRSQTRCFAKAGADRDLSLSRRAACHFTGLLPIPIA